MDFASINLYTYSVSSIANILSSILDDDELALLAAVFAQLGDTLATIAVLRTTSPKKSTSDENSQNDGNSNTSSPVFAKDDFMDKTNKIANILNFINDMS